MEIKHVFKKANKCVDTLANLNRIQEDDFVLFDSLLPLFVVPSLLITLRVFLLGLYPVILNIYSFLPLRKKKKKKIPLQLLF